MEVNFNKPFHAYFIGIGGISMSGLASIILKKGFKVSGSDRAESELIENLRKEGATIYCDQSVSHIPDDVDLIIYTAAIGENNPEYVKMMSMDTPHMTRAEFLGQLMRNYETPIGISGTNGKTTTTSMISEVLLSADTDPTLSIGGILKSIGSNTRDGGRDYFVFEACEYTNSFLSFFPKISVILNIEEDHLDFFKDINDIRNSFRKYAELLPDDGFLVINGEIDNLQEIVRNIKCEYATYGPDSRFDYYPTDISFNEEGHPTFKCNDRKTGESYEITLSLTGEHNVYNSLAAYAVCKRLGLSGDVISKALSKSTGSKRRFEFKGSFNGVRVIDDYAHNPEEITATINAARNIKCNKLWVVFQPHTYSRTKQFLKEFRDALKASDKIVLADVYAAREKDEFGVNSQTLYDELKSVGADVNYFKSFDEIKAFLYKNCINGDLLITMGAGDVVKISDEIIEK